jgi:hypothetical protein
MTERFKKWTLPTIQDPIHKFLIESNEQEGFSEKAEKFWKEKKWFDIFIKYSKEGDKIILAVERMTQEEYDKLETKENYMKERKLIEYMCQYPHDTWEKAIKEYELFSKIFEFDADDVFSKTQYFPERDRIWFPKNKIKYRSLKEGQRYSNKDFVFSSLMYTFLKDEINNVKY